MFRPAYPLFGLLFTLLQSSPTQATEATILRHTSLDELRQDFLLSNRLFSSSTANPSQLIILSSHEHPQAHFHIRLSQYYMNFPVYGGQAILHTDQPFNAASPLKNTLNTHLSGSVFKGLTAELGRPPLNFTERAQRALTQFKSTWRNATIEHEAVIPIIYVDKHHEAHWAYQVNLSLLQTNGTPAQPAAILDAQTFLPYQQWNDLKTLKTLVQGIGFGGNPVMGTHQYGKEKPALSILRDNLTQSCFMRNKQINLTDMHHRQTADEKTMSFPCETPADPTRKTYWTGYLSDGYDTYNEALSPANDAFFFAETTRKLYKTWYHIDPLVDKQNMPMRLQLRVHYGENYNNAFWNGEEITFGDGNANLFYPLVSLEVTAHEISHGFTQQHSNLIYFGQSGAINESFSDMAAKAAEYLADEFVNWKIGHNILKPQSGHNALRHMDLPSQDGISVDSLDAYLRVEAETGEAPDVHHGSGVFNRLFYLIASKPGWNIHKAFDIMIYANMDYWTPTTTFQEGGCGIMSTAKELGYSLQDVRDALSQVGIQANQC